MFRQTSIAGLLAFAAAMPALAQTDPVAMGHTSAANQLGILEYCQSRGDVGPEAVLAQKDVIARLPASAVDTSSAEALGKTGTMTIPNGQTMTLDSMVSSRNMTVSSLCKQLGSSATQSAAMYKQNSMPQMPTGMPQMPTGMPQMPAGTPQMPAMPATPPQ